MNRFAEHKQQTVFHSLTPETVLSLVEGVLAVQCTNLCRPLNSYINRVYELETEDGAELVVKFYRPGRWSRQALQDEHDFLLELVGEEIPVVVPLRFATGETLGQQGDMFFSVFRKKGGRSFDEYSDEQWLELGRLLGRTHAVGAKQQPKDRIVMTPDTSTRYQVDYLLTGDFIPAGLVDHFAEIANTLISEISPLFTDVPLIRIHGDCHFANLIYRPGESFYLIDFDDMVVGPPVHDFWMLLPGYMNDSSVEIDIFLEGYETFRDFDRQTLALIEPLRAMRYLYYTAWCAHQVAEDGVSLVAPDFGSYHYWQREITDLVEQLERIRKAPQRIGGNF